MNTVGVIIGQLIKWFCMGFMVYLGIRVAQILIG